MCLHHKGILPVAKWIVFLMVLVRLEVFAASAELALAHKKPGTPSDIRGILITSNPKNIHAGGRSDIQGVEIQDLSIPGKPEELEALLKPYLGRKLNLDTAIEIKGQVLLYYQKHQQLLVDIEMPKQSTVEGVLQILVLKQQFGRPVYIYKGQQWYTDAQLSQYLGIVPHQEISEDVLQNNLSWLNRNPFHYSTTSFVPAEEPGVSNLEVTTTARSPLRWYTRADDTGSASTGYGRFAGGFSWGNALWRGDLLTFEYDCSNDFMRYQSYMGAYTSFLPWQHLLLLFGSYAKVNPKIPPEPDVPPTHAMTAHATQAYLHYTIPIKPMYTPFSQEISFGFEYKNTNSNTVSLSGGVVETQLIGPPVMSNLNVTQFYANYTMRQKVSVHDIIASADFYGSPGALLPHQSNQDFGLLRPNSKNQYCYAFITAADVITLPNIMTISVLLRGQVSNDTLPSTELINLGGYNTIRGYHEAELSTDNGLIVNVELRSLPISLWRSVGDQLIFLAFWDYGLGNNWFVQKITGIATPPHTQYLMGVGPGIRYTINPYLQARIDYGFKLHQLFTNNAAAREIRLGFGQFHLGLLLSY